MFFKLYYRLKVFPNNFALPSSIYLFFLSLWCFHPFSPGASNCKINVGIWCHNKKSERGAVVMLLPSSPVGPVHPIVLVVVNPKTRPHNDSTFM